MFTKSSLRKLWDNARSCASHKVEGTHAHTSKETLSTEQCRAHHIIDKGQKEGAGKKRAEHRERLTEERTQQRWVGRTKTSPVTGTTRLSQRTSKGVHENKCCEIWKRGETPTERITLVKGQHHFWLLPRNQNFVKQQMNWTQLTFALKVLEITIILFYCCIIQKEAPTIKGEA